ncbi:hypothetical protein BRAS3809_1760002 [Bradyrhizobium sp. STM 3809]|nr:hypothetical protein BRAS3809_1760002 [Bradyrhizobium sp. STM 3809]
MSPASRASVAIGKPGPTIAGGPWPAVALWACTGVTAAHNICVTQIATHPRKERVSARPVANSVPPRDGLTATNPRG